MVRQEVPDEPQPENSKFWKPKIGDKTEGRLLRSEKGKFGDQFVIRKTDTTEQVLPADTHLMQKLQKVQIGDYVWITMIGEKDTGQPKPMKVYRVEHDPDYKELSVQNIPQTPATETTPAPKADATSMLEPFYEWMVNNVKSPMTEAQISKKIIETKAGADYNKVRRACLIQLSSDNDGRVIQDLTDEKNPKYSVA